MEAVCVWATDTISTDSKNKSHFDLLDWLQVLLTPSVTLSLVYCQLVCLLLVRILNLSSLYKLLGCFENKLFQLNACKLALKAKCTSAINIADK